MRPSLLLDYLLASRELELCPPECLDDGLLVLVVGPDRHQRLSDPDPGNGSLGLPEGTSHPGLEPVSSGARQHLVDPEHVVRMDTDADVELVLGRVLHHVLDGGGKQRGQIKISM